ncbi:MAG TPA: ATP-binding protein [Bacteriovoracaceae bacterium]|nr:ATP-binding protein [Bacteriovoracaceae bacterium]
MSEKMLEPFFSTKDIGQGTGLGLSISKGIIEGHGGSLVYDQDSPHTRFVIKLPLIKD